MILSVNEMDELFAKALIELGIDVAYVAGMRYDDAFKLIVATQFKIIKGLGTKLEAGAVLDCPYCGTSELLCGYPNECCTVKDDE